MSNVPFTMQRLHELGLRGMAQAYERQQSTPSLQKKTFDARLAELLDVETSERESRKIERYLKSAKLRFAQATLEDVDYKSDRGIDRSRIMALSDCEWIRRKQNLILTGATGTGKSWMACAFGNQACRLGFNAYYTTSTKLFEDIAFAHADGSLPKLRRQLIKIPLLIIDDLGIGGIAKHLGPALLEIVDLQSMNGSLLLTSQIPTEKWYDLFGDPTIADAILDRIIHRSHLMELTGESMRKRRGKNL